MKSIKISTGLVRLSYAHLAEPNEDPNGNRTYNCQLIFDKNDKTTARIQDAIKRLKTEDDVISLFNKKFKDLKEPLRDGDEDEADFVTAQPEVYNGKYFISAKSDRKPKCYDKDKSPIDDFEIEEELYSGCYVQAVVNIYAYNFKNQSKGFGVGLLAVRKIKDGQQLSGATVSEADFDDDDFGDDENVFD